MLSTAISIEFIINDLDATYQIIGTSKNYSFDHNLGRGDTLVDFVGGVASKVISLEGNYGEFDVKLFAENLVGIRSSFLRQKINVKPPRFNGTFSFANIRVDNLPEDSKIGASVKKSVSSDSNQLIVDSEYIDREVSFSWKLNPPIGHALEGQVVDYDLINDSMFSGFRVELFDDGQKIDFSQLDPLSDAATSLSSDLNTAPGNIDDILNNYKQFNFNISSDTFDSLDLSRDIYLNVIAVDYFGSTSTGTIYAKNHAPTIFNFSESLSSSRMSFSWAEGDTDYSGVNIKLLGAPSEYQIYDNKDLLASQDYLERVSNARVFDFTIGSRYFEGDMVLYSDGLVYECVNSHTRQSSSADPGNDSNWLLVGDQIDYIYESFDLNSFTFNFDQDWKYSYYYQLQGFDNYGGGPVFNLTENLLVEKGADGSELKGFFSELKLSQIEFREQEDDFLFNWDVLDQDNNSVDIDKYRFPLSPTDVPVILGISGSLFDVDTNTFLTGLTEGFNSRSLIEDQDGNTTISASLPSTRNFSSFLYTRDLNNQIYKDGGYVSNYQDYDSNDSYVVGDIVLAKNNLLYESLIDTNSIQPIYDEWSRINDYVVGDKITYQDNVLNCIQEFGPSRFALYSENDNYTVGDIVVAPSINIQIFDQNKSYDASDRVLFEGSIYSAIVDISSSESTVPSVDSNKWRVLSAFNDVSCDYYQLISTSSVGVPNQDRGNWKKVSPLILAQAQEFFEIIVPAYEFNVSNWSTEKRYNKGDFVVYQNDVWSGMSSTIGEIPSDSSEFWANTSDGQNIGEFSSYLSRNYTSGDFVYNNNSVYECIRDNPVGGPIEAYTNSSLSINSSYESSQWKPVWENNTNYDNFVFKHVGIPESGKRSVGIEIGIIDINGNILDKKRRTAINYAPVITDDGFNKEVITPVDSLSEATKVKFRYNYTDEGIREKTTRVNLYRSSESDFTILNDQGLPFMSENEVGSTLVKTVLGAADAVLGVNINEIIDNPPVNIVNGIEEQAGYFYKILPFDDFGSGYLYEIEDKVKVVPSNYSNRSENGIPGPVISLTEDDIPGPVLNFNGDTAFTTYFLNWSMPGSQVSSNGIIDIPPNDLSHYEIWLSDEKILQDSSQDWAIDDNSGYRRFVGDVKSTIGASENIPLDAIDPGKSITNATSIFNVPANSPSVETSYIGNQGDTGYFWIRAVDKAGNKSKFVGSSDPNADYVEGLELKLGGVQTTDVVDFQKNITTEFKNTIALDPSDPFDYNAGTLSWAQHDVWLDGDKYDISAGSLSYVNSGYVWWDYDSSEYSGSNTHPAGSDGFDKLEQFNDGDFIVAKNSSAGHTLAYHAFANALIGTAQISEAAITDAKIQTLTADKITAGQIKGHKIEITHSGGSNSDQYGSIASVGFSGLQFSESEQGVLDQSINGFVLSGDGSFAFQQGKGGLSFEDDELTIRGRLRQKNNKDYDFVDIDLSSSVVGYIETEDGFELDQGQVDVSIDLTFRNSSVASASHILIKIKDENNESIVPVGQTVDAVTHLGDDWYRLDDLDQEGFEWNQVLNDSNGLKSSSISLSAAKFNEYINANNNGSEFITIYVSSVHSDLQKKASITRLVDGKAAESLRLTASSQVFKVDKYGVALPETQNIEISVDVQNNNQLISWSSSSANVKIYDYDDQNVEINGDVNQNKKVIIKASELIGNNLDSVKITASTAAAASSGSVSDKITLVIVEDGSNEVSAILSNENHTFTQSLVAGNLQLDATESGTEIELFDGAQLLTPKSKTDYDSLTDKTGHYYVTALSSNEIIHDPTPTIPVVNKKIEYNNVTISDHSLTSASTTFTIQGTKKNGETFGPIVKKQTFSVSKTGLHAPSVRLSADSQIFKVDKYGVSTSTETIIITADVQNTGGDLEFESDIPGLNLTADDNSSVSVNLSNLQDASLTKITVTASVNPQGNISAVSDKITLVIVEEGSNAITPILSNENHTFTQSLVAGNLQLDATESGTEIELFDGAQLLTPKSKTDYDSLTDKTGHYYVTALSSNEIIHDPTPTIPVVNKKIEYNNVTISDHSLTSASTTFTIQGTKKNGETFGPIVKKQTFSVSKRGTDGEPGENSISIVYTNQNHSVPTDKEGNNADFTGSGGLFEVFDGVTKLNVNTSGTSAPTTIGKFNVELQHISGIQLTNGLSIDTDNNTCETSFANTSLTSVTVYRLTAHVRNLNGDTLSKSVDITISPVKGGEDGKTAVTVELSSSHYAIRYSVDPVNENNLIADPASFTLSATTRNLEGTNPTYTYKRDGIGISQVQNISAGNLTDYPITYSVELSVGDSIVAADSITIIALRDGNIGRNGRTPTYRGNWTSLLEELDVGGVIKFEQTDTRGDIVEFNTSGDNYWICTTPHWVKKVSSTTYSFSDDGSTFGTAYILTNAYWIADSDYWDQNWTNFGTELDNVATDILLTKEAYITNKLNIGNNNAGAIRSNGFVGGLLDIRNEDSSLWQTPPSPEDYSTAGFLLAYKGGNSYFDIGANVKDLNDQDIPAVGGGFVKSYMRFSSSSRKIEIRGAFMNNTSENDVLVQLAADGSTLQYNNVLDTLATFVGGGYKNDITAPTAANTYQSLASSVIGGANNSVEGRFSMIGNGYSNECKDNFSAIVGGYQNKMVKGGADNQGSNFIGAGQNNVIDGGTNQSILGGQNNNITYSL